MFQLRLTYSFLFSKQKRRRGFGYHHGGRNLGSSSKTPSAGGEVSNSMDNNKGGGNGQGGFVQPAYGQPGYGQYNNLGQRYSEEEMQARKGRTHMQESDEFHGIRWG